jgi:hypothetical protein
MTDLPDMKVRAQVLFPATVNGGTGIDVTKDGGTYKFDLDYNEIARILTVATPVRATTFLVMWESTTNTFSRISLPDFKLLLASMP